MEKLLWGTQHRKRLGKMALQPYAETCAVRHGALTSLETLIGRVGVQGQQENPSAEPAFSIKNLGSLGLSPFEIHCGTEFHQDQTSESGLVFNYFNSDSKYIRTTAINLWGNRVCLVARFKSFPALFRHELWTLRCLKGDHRENRQTRKKLGDKLEEEGYRYNKSGQFWKGQSRDIYTRWLSNAWWLKV